MTSVSARSLIHAAGDFSRCIFRRQAIYSPYPTMSYAPSKALTGYPAVGLIAVTRAALGCGIGMIVADKFGRSSTRTATAIALLSVGVLGSVPGLVQSVMNVVNRPGSERSMNRRLASIRANSGFDNGTEMF